jgi:hypothetical protein
MDQERRDFMKGAGMTVAAAVAAQVGPAAARPKLVYEISKPRPSPSRMFETGTVTFSNRTPWSGSSTRIPASA